MIEEWKKIPKYGGKYLVSSNGRVLSKNYRGNTNKTKILKQSMGSNVQYLEPTPQLLLGYHIEFIKESIQ
jgi:hypothetical protein